MVPDPNKVGVSFYLERELHRRLRIAAAHTDVPMSVYIAVVLDHVLPGFGDDPGVMIFPEITADIDQWVIDYLDRDLAAEQRPVPKPSPNAES
jgi:hypothetical protein